MSENDNDWLDGLTDDGITIEAAADRCVETALSAHRILPMLLLESVIDAAGFERIERQQGFCLIVQAPSADWVEPLFKAIRTLGDWDYQQAKNSTPRSRHPDESATANVVTTLSGGGRIFGVSQSPKTMLASTMNAAADMTVVLPTPSAEVIAAAIRSVTGKDAGNVPKGVAAGLTFDEIATCLRRNSTPEQCLERLVRAVDGKRITELVGDDVPEIKDLHGYGEAQTWALNLIADLEAWRRGEIELRDIDKNVVLASSPGLGKTTFAKALARSTGLPLIATSVGAWFANSPGYLDSIIKQIDEVFGAAQAIGPAVILLDELDGMVNRATVSPKNADWWAPVIGHMLTVLDGATSLSSNLIVIGATNHPEKLDAALIRPGRLNRVIHIAQPDEASLQGIIRQHLGSNLEGEDVTEAARLGAGHSGAHAVEWVKAARRFARTAGRPMVMTDLLKAVAPEDRRAPKLVQRIAIHEAGHAVVGHMLKMGSVEAVSIVASGINGGNTRMKTDGAATTREALENYACYALGGRAAEEVILGSVGAGSGGDVESDLGNATRTLGMIHLGIGLGDTLIYRGAFEEVPQLLANYPDIATKVEADLRRLYSRALEICRREVDLVRAVGAELLERRYVGRDRFRKIVAENQVVAVKGEIEHG